MGDALEFPSSLFRYRGFNTSYALDELRAAVFERKIFLSDANAVNDPFDLRPLYVESPLKDVLKDLKFTHRSKPSISRERYSELAGRPVTREEYRSVSANFKPSVESAKMEIALNGNAVKKLRIKSKMACLSERNDNIPMWAHYCQNHSGFCIGYELNLENHSDDMVPLKVEYGATRPTLSTLDLRSFMMRSRDSDKYDKDSMRVFSAMYLHKSEDWAYEQEWRLFDSNDDPPCYKKVGALSVSTIFLGINVGEKDMEAVKRIAADRVAIKKAKISETTFSLDFLDID